MSLTDLPDAFLRTILTQLAALLLQGAGGDIDAAYQAAIATLRAYDPRTEAEFRLAARIIACSLQAGEALAQTVNPDLPLTRVLRLRSGAVALSREAEKAEHRLDKLRAARLTAPDPLPEVELIWQPLGQTPGPTVEAAVDTVTDTPDMVSEDTSANVWAADPWAKLDIAAAPSPANAPSSPPDDRHKIATYAAANGLTWTEALKQRRREHALAERRRKEAMHSQAA